MHWLNRKAKDIPQPVLLIVERITDAGGLYYRPSKEPLRWQGKEYDCHNGVLMVAAVDDIANAIAHEWRHHWQWFNCQHCLPAARFNPVADYEKEIVRFFRHPRELDALRFSHAVAPSEVSALWMDLIGG